MLLADLLVTCYDYLSKLVFVYALMFDRWVVEYHIDGFHFHSLSSMMYTHNGFTSFAGDMEE